MGRGAKKETDREEERYDRRSQRAAGERRDRPKGLQKEDQRWGGRAQ